jgi:uncharacterized membrane protein YGL010W
MRSADEWFEAYGVSHRNPVNKAIHWVCVPVITFCTIGLFAAIPHPYFEGVLPGAFEPALHWGSVLIVLALLLFYLRLSLTLALAMGLFAAGSVWGNVQIEAAGYDLLTVNLVAFVVAWIGQFIGHKIEGMKPSFFEDLQFLLVGPAWLIHFVFRKLGVPY